MLCTKDFMNIPDGNTPDVAPGTEAFTTHKFGSYLAYDPATSGAATVWDGDVDDYPYMTEGTTLYIASSSASDTGTVRVQGLEEDASGNWVWAAESVTLTGQSPVAMSTNWVRVFRALAVDDELVGTVRLSSDDTEWTDGVPDTAANTRLVIQPGIAGAQVNQTRMALYTVPYGFKGYLTKVSINLATTASGPFAADTVCTVRFLVRRKGGTWRTAGERELSSAGSSNIEILFDVPPPIEAEEDVKVVIVGASEECKINAEFTIVNINETPFVE